MSSEPWEIEPEPRWLELPLELPRERSDEQRDRDDDDSPPGVIVIELV